MKKKILAVLLAAVMVFSFTACDKAQDDGVFVLSEDSLDEYVTLTEDYDVFNVEIDPIEITEDDINTELNYLIMDMVGGSEKLQKLVNRQVVSGDTVVIDYVGTKDGVAFEGGTSTSSTNLTIGSGTFIPGFEDGLIGTKPGDVVTLDLTFPEDFSSEELAGQAVQFEVTVHYILPTFADVTDDVVADLYEGFTTVSDLRKKVSQDIYDTTYDSSVEYAVVALMEEKCTYSETLPEELRQVAYDNVMQNIATYASYYGMDTETYIYLSYYQDLETFQNETAWEIADYSVKNLLFCQADANEKDLNVTEAELDEQLESYASYYGISVEDGFTDAEIDAIKNTMMNLKVVNYIIENASVTIKEASEETEKE